MLFFVIGKVFDIVGGWKFVFLYILNNIFYIININLYIIYIFNNIL